MKIVFSTRLLNYIFCSTGEITKQYTKILYSYNHIYVVRDSVFGIVTSYRPDGAGIESYLGRDFLRPSRPALDPTLPIIKWVKGLFPGDKVAGAWRWPPNPSSAEVKEIVELNFYSPSGLSWPVLGWNVYLYLFT
jgi:hypothetical protein